MVAANQFPEFETTFYFHEEPESLQPQYIMTVTASDPDGQALKYTIESTVANVLAINSSTGDIRSIVGLDADTGASSYDFEVYASDGSLSTAADVVLRIGDLNDNSPIFFPETYAATLGEDADVEDQVVQVKATDADRTSKNNRIGYTISAGNPDGLFYVELNTGVVRVNGTLDYETATSHVLTILAKDTGSPSRSDTATVTISITDKNDNPPVFDAGSYSASVSELAAFDTFVLKCGVTDADSGSNGAVSLKIVTSSGDKSTAFAIDSNGNVTVLQGLDRDGPNGVSLYSLSVVATDGGSPSQTRTAPLSITILDENDNTPVFSSNNYDKSVLESLAVGSQVVKLEATDADIDANGAITFSLDDSVDSLRGYFFLDSSTGAITLAKALDFENSTSRVFDVKASDGGSPSRSTAPLRVTITIQDVNDNAPVFSKSMYSANVTETTAVGTTVAVVRATDEDTGLFGKVVYSFVAADGAPFAIGSDSGEVTVSSALNFESVHEYRLTVQARDSASPALSTTATLVLTVLDVNEHSPQFSAASYACSLAENLAAGATCSASISATDADGTGNIVTYSLQSSEDAFAIDSSTGVVSTTAALDRETRASYSLTVVATDSGSPSRSNTISLAVTVTDVNDNSPVFDDATINVLFSEDTDTSERRSGMEMGNVTGVFCPFLYACRSEVWVTVFVCVSPPLSLEQVPPCLQSSSLAMLAD